MRSAQRQVHNAFRYQNLHHIKLPSTHILYTRLGYLNLEAPDSIPWQHQQIRMLKHSADHNVFLPDCTACIGNLHCISYCFYATQTVLCAVTKFLKLCITKNWISIICLSNTLKNLRRIISTETYKTEMITDYWSQIIGVLCPHSQCFKNPHPLIKIPACQKIWNKE